MYFGILEKELNEIRIEKEGYSDKIISIIHSIENIFPGAEIVQTIKLSDRQGVTCCIDTANTDKIRQMFHRGFIPFSLKDDDNMQKLGLINDLKEAILESIIDLDDESENEKLTAGE
jgi:hypothetical protein